MNPHHAVARGIDPCAGIANPRSPGDPGFNGSGAASCTSCHRTVAMICCAQAAGQASRLNPMNRLCHSSPSAIPSYASGPLLATPW